MESELFKLIVNNGAWAALFVWLLIDTRKESKVREEKLQSIINNNQEVIGELADKYDVIEDIKGDITEIKLYLNKEIR